MASRNAGSVTNPSRGRIWLSAIRPKTLLLSLGPVILATQLAWIEAGPEAMRWFLLPAIAISAMSIQIATNLWNDAADATSGLDDKDTRLGPPRMTSLGLLSAAQVRRAALLFLTLATLCGLVLVFAGGIPIMIIGSIGLLCAIGYSSGPYPIAASPFGELFVLAFFGILAVGGSFLLLTGFWSHHALLAGLYAGLPAVAVLTVNNHRDRVGDEAGGRRTLAILLGPTSTKFFYSLTMLLSGLGLVHLGQGDLASLATGAIALILALALPIRALWHAKSGPDLNKVLAQTAAFQIVWIILHGVWLMI